MYNTSHGLKDVENAGHKMAIVREVCNVNDHANIPVLFMTILCPWLCVKTSMIFSLAN